MNIKKITTNTLIATTILITGTTTVQTTHENQTANAAVNYYSKNQCTWYVFNKRASVGKPVPNSWGNAKNWYYKAKNSGYRVGRVPAKRAVMQSTVGTYGHVAYGTRILSKSAAAKYNYIY
ncbi:CHAP domain-containing protein [Staphylococcus xylosus]